MAIAFCSASDRLVYTNGRDQKECPVCAGLLTETEESIKKRVIYLEPPPPDTVILTDLPAQKSDSTRRTDDEETKEGKT